MSDKQNNEEALVINKILDKGKLAAIKQHSVYTDFLNLHEQSLFLASADQLTGIYHIFYGGYDYSERKIIAFYPDYMDQEDIIYPIDALKIYPRNKKFSNNLTHRDFLGSILGLGITRAKVGDIIVNDDFALAFVCRSISDFIMSSLEMVKQTVVDVELLHTIPEEVTTPKYKDIRGTVSSIRLDSIVSLAFPLSRGKAVASIKSKNVYINSKLIVSPSCKLREGDIVSVRGMGKFLFHSIGNKTKKDRIYIELKRYT